MSLHRTYNRFWRGHQTLAYVHRLGSQLGLSPGCPGTAWTALMEGTWRKLCGGKQQHVRGKAAGAFEKREGVQPGVETAEQWDVALNWK